MTERKTRRFYKTVSVAETDGGFGVFLDGKQAKTSGHSALILPNRALAEAVAEEWRAQGEKIESAGMPLTKLANMAVAHMPHRRAQVANRILGFGRSELLCYRAEAPPELASRQSKAWDPLLDWLHKRHGARLKTGTGIGFIEQPGEAAMALDKAVWAHDDFALAALHEAAGVTGSLVLALALADGRLDAAEALALSRIDEAYQAEKWGEDAEAVARARALATDLAAAERFLRLVHS